MLKSIFPPFVCASRIAVLLIIASCQPSEDMHSEVGSCLPDCVGSRSYDVQSYALRGRFDWSTQRLIASEDLSLLLPPNPAAAVIELDAAVEVHRVYAGQSSLIWVLDAQTNKLRVDLSPLHPSAGPVAFTIDYEAKTASSLIAAQARDGDPTTSRVVFTSSEPDLGVYWLVGKHHPSDRARFSVELTVESDEDVIANGTRATDVQLPYGRRVRYEMDKPLPTYLMAFAAGQLEKTERTSGRVPLAVYHRRGLLIDPEPTLDAVADAMATFERLLGPYPWESYTVVLLPQGPGMENATITFDPETSAQGRVSFTLNAHELAHHWFGDWVTMRDFDDLWIKEGMATLLQYEADRARSDGENKGRFFGLNLPFRQGDAIRDPELIGLNKYTSGPYRRAAWLLTQIRVAVGETAFFAALRNVLLRHALDSIDSETFVRSFAPALDEAAIQKILGALNRKPPPTVTIDVQPRGADSAVTLSLSDPSSTLLTPIGLTVVDANGLATTHTLNTTAPLELVVPQGGYLAPDEADVHPTWAEAFSVDRTVFYQQLLPLFLPGSTMARAAFTSRSPSHVERTLANYGLPSIPPSALAGFYKELDSPAAKNAAELGGCYTLQYLTNNGGDVMGWTAALAPILMQPAIEAYNTRYAYCGIALAEQTFETEFAQLADKLTAANAARFAYLQSFDYGALKSLMVLSRVASSAPSLQLREQAISRLVAQTRPGSGYSPISPADVPLFKSFFRVQLDNATTQFRFAVVWPGIVGLSDDGALATVGRKLHTITMSDTMQRQVVCDAWIIARTRPAAWTEFAQAAEPWNTLDQPARAALMDPTQCAKTPDGFSDDRRDHTAGGIAEAERKF